LLFASLPPGFARRVTRFPAASSLHCGVVAAFPRVVKRWLTTAMWRCVRRVRCLSGRNGAKCALRAFNTCKAISACSAINTINAAKHQCLVVAAQSASRFLSAMHQRPVASKASAPHCSIVSKLAGVPQNFTTLAKRHHCWVSLRLCLQGLT
jgi:hypothetical protein